jgi:hypothetical protein
MGYAVKETGIKTIKPGSSTAFNPTYEVESVRSVAKGGADYIYAKLKPLGGGADMLGLQTLRMPAILAPGTALWTFAELTGQNPTEGFSVDASIGARVRFGLEAVEAPAPEPAPAKEK